MKENVIKRWAEVDLGHPGRKEWCLTDRPSCPPVPIVAETTITISGAYRLTIANVCSKNCFYV